MITILQNSPLQLTGSTQYLNTDSFDSKAFFTSTGSTLYYTLMRVEEDGDIKLINDNLLTGHYNGITYDYTFNFNNYIIINNQTIPELEVITGTTVIGTSLENNITVRYFSKNKSCQIYFIVSATEIVESNLLLNILTRKVNGEVVLRYDRTIDEIVADETFDILFIDGIYNNPSINLPSIEMINGNDYPITVYNNNNLKVIIKTSTDTTYYMLPKQLTDINEIRVYIFNVPKNCLSMEIYEMIDTDFILRNTIYSKSNYNCYKDYYYMNDNGVFDIIRCNGTSNTVDTIGRKQMQLGNRNIQLKINYTKEIKQNTGFNITQGEIYSLLRTPIVYLIEDTDVRTYIINTNSFNGYNGKLSTRNIELSLIDPKLYNRKTNYTIGNYD